jgi:[ribosomal protein S5]-alanine N-acetyltransferase
VIVGKIVSLRPIAEADLEELHAKLIDMESRGPWYPMPRTSLTKRRRAFEETGFWSPEEGIFVMVDEQDRLVGTVDWNRLNGDVPDTELGYRVFDRSNWGKGIATEALDLLAGFLFDTEPINRLRLTIHVANVGSRRVAEKCGFTREGTSREAWYHKGRWHDIDVFALTRAESDERRKDR